MIASFDLGRQTGVCVDGRTETLDLDALIGPALSRFEGFVRGRIKDGVRVFAFEAPMMAFGSGARSGIVNHLYRQFGMAATLFKLSHEAGLVAAPYQVRSVRKRLCGSAKASPTKILATCRSRGLSPVNDHEADAGLIWLAAREDFHMIGEHRAA